jgi:hypothetical protein
VGAHFSLDQSQEEIEREARTFVKEYFGGRDKDRDAAKRLLLSQVKNRIDPKSMAIKKILGADE